MIDFKGLHAHTAYQELSLQSVIRVINNAVNSIASDLCAEHHLMVAHELLHPGLTCTTPTDNLVHTTHNIFFKVISAGISLTAQAGVAE